MARVLLHLAAIIIFTGLVAAQEEDQSRDGRRGISTADFRKLFLEQGDLPIGMLLKQQSLALPPDANDPHFLEFGGLRTGLRVWLADNKNSIVFRIADIRMIFPSDDAATSYIRQARDYLSEGADYCETPVTPGQDSMAFGPDQPAAKAVGSNVRAFTFIFREKNVVVKIFVSQGDGAGEPLEAPQVAKLAAAALLRISPPE